MAQEIRQLAEDQLAQFGHHLHSEAMEAKVFEHLQAQFGDSPFEFLDVGGGIGSFTDRVLARFPHAQGIVLDNSELLLAKNQPHPRKKTILASVEALHAHLAPASLDVVFVNLMLHHLVGAGYGASLANIQQTLEDVTSLLKPKGFLSVIEQCYEGLLLHNLPSHLMYHLTASKLLAALTRRMGANTAGIGVCFQSQKSWRKKFSQLKNIRILDQFAVFDEGLSNHHLLIRLALHVRTTNRVLFWMAKA